LLDEASCSQTEITLFSKQVSYLPSLLTQNIALYEPQMSRIALEDTTIERFDRKYNGAMNHLATWTLSTTFFLLVKGLKHHLA